MEFVLIVLVLGLANWFATTLIVDSEFFRPLREWIGRKEWAAEKRWVLALASQPGNKSVPLKTRLSNVFWLKMTYLIGCHTCTGTWVGLAIAAFLPTGLIVPGIWPGAGFLLNALAIKAVGHLTLAWVNRQNARIDLDKVDARARQQEGQAAEDVVRQPQSFSPEVEFGDGGPVTDLGTVLSSEIKRPHGGFQGF